MDVIKGSPSSDLRSLVNRSAIDRMEKAYQDGARHELARRASLPDLELFAHLVKAAEDHLQRYEAQGDSSCLRWAEQLQAEARTVRTARLG